MAVTQADLKVGKNRYAVITKDGDPYKLSADTEEQAKAKAEEFFGVEIFKVSLISPWKGGSVEAK